MDGLRRTGKITRRLVCSLVFCFAGVAAAQSLTDNVSAVADGSAASSVSASADEPVNASASEAMFPDSARAGEAMFPHSASQSGGSASRPASINALTVTSSSFHPDWRVGPGNLSPIYRVAGSKRRATPGGKAGKPKLRSSGTGLGPPGTGLQSSSGTGKNAAYSGNFADSTKGTAWISPTDSGTQSPLDWTPRLSVGFLDFQQTQFLNPTFHTLAPRKRTRASGRKAATRHIVSKPARSPSIDEQLGLKAPSVEQDILSQGRPSTSIDEQLGLQ
jgi:hypothetical protein